MDFKRKQDTKSVLRTDARGLAFFFFKVDSFLNYIKNKHTKNPHVKCFKVKSIIQNCIGCSCQLQQLYLKYIKFMTQQETQSGSPRTQEDSTTVVATWAEEQQ